MALKIIGTALLVLSGFTTGCMFSKNLCRRRDFLKDFVSFMSALATHIRYESYDIFTLVNMCAENSLVCLTFTATDKTPFDEQWRRKVAEIPKQYSLKKSDRQLLCEFGAGLGKTDVDGQLKHIELYKNLFAKQLANAEDAVKQKTKLYKTMGFFVGTAAALMMI